MQLGEVYAGLQLRLNDGCRVEVEERGTVGAVGYVLMRMEVCGVRDGSRGEIAFTVVENVSGVEVMYVEIAGDIGDGGVEATFDGTFDRV